MKQIIFSLLFSAMTATTAMAVPALSQWFTHVQPDGTTLRLRLVGDEFFSYYETEDGTLMKQTADGNYEPTDDNSYSLEWKRALAADLSQRRNERNSLSPSMRQAISDGTRKKGLVIIMQFPDQAVRDDNSWNDWNAILNEDGFSENYAAGSVYNYFKDQSNGALLLNFDLLGPFTAYHERSYYGTNGRNYKDEHAYELVAEACQAVKDKVDFGDYDWDGDGQVEQVVVVFAGSGESVSGNPSEWIWPHESSMIYFPPYNQTQGLVIGKHRITTYALVSELTFGTNLSGLGTFCHEFSHCLGLPDFYTYTGIDTMGDYDLMASGNHNNNGWCPANYTAYQKMYCGWYTPIELTEATSISNMVPLSNGGDAYIIRNKAVQSNVDEYFLLECRLKDGWDKYIPSQGMTITHYDYDEWSWRNNQVNNDANHPRATIIPANNKYTQKDASGFTYPYGLIKPINSFTDSSTPAAKVYHRPAGASFASQYYLGKPITNIKFKNRTISFNFMGGDTSGILDVTATETLIGQPLDIHDLSGRRLRHIDRYEGTEQLHLPSGIYIIGGRKVRIK